jgi:hypothetical protein
MKRWADFDKRFNAHYREHLTTIGVSMPKPTEKDEKMRKLLQDERKRLKEVAAATTAAQ